MSRLVIARYFYEADYGLNDKKRDDRTAQTKSLQKRVHIARSDSTRLRGVSRAKTV